MNFGGHTQSIAGTIKKSNICAIAALGRENKVDRTESMLRHIIITFLKTKDKGKIFKVARDNDILPIEKYF